MTVPATYQRELAKLFVKHDDAKVSLDSSTASAKAAGMLGDKNTVAHLAHLHERFRRAGQDLKMFLCNIIANPEWFEEVVLWMVDVQGISEGDISEFAKPEIKALASTDPQSFEHKMFEVGGSQMLEVYNMLREDSFKVTDKNLVDDNRWILGSQCTEEDSRDLCRLMYENYGDEIKMGVISIRRMPWNLGIEGMTSAAEARAWLRKNPE